MCGEVKGTEVYWTTVADPSIWGSHKVIGLELEKKSKHLKEKGKQEKGFLPTHTGREGAKTEG